MRQIVLDTETMGLDPKKGHRLIEVGCLELINRRLTGEQFHFYVNPEREVEPGAYAVHGISNEFLADKPLFAEIAEPLREFLDDAELIIHNAPFDLGFLNHEFRLNKPGCKLIEKHNAIIDTLTMARQLHPGQKNNLDALCKRYHVDNSSRELHGALLDAEILALVYLAMTGGQETLFAEEKISLNTADAASEIKPLRANRPPLVVIQATAEELQAHQDYLDKLHSQK